MSTEPNAAHYIPRQGDVEVMEQNAMPDIIPGTDIIFAGGQGGGEGEGAANNEVVLVPQPTSNPDDPLVSIAHHITSHPSHSSLGGNYLPR